MKQQQQEQQLLYGAALLETSAAGHTAGGSQEQWYMPKLFSHRVPMGTREAHTKASTTSVRRRDMVFGVWCGERNCA